MVTLDIFLLSTTAISSGLCVWLSVKNIRKSEQLSEIKRSKIKEVFSRDLRVFEFAHIIDQNFTNLSKINQDIMLNMIKGKAVQEISRAIFESDALEIIHEDWKSIVDLNKDQVRIKIRVKISK